MQKILVLAANPIGTSKLRLDEELREIQEALRRARKREQFELLSVPAVRHQDLRRSFLDNKPQFVHFSGHGSGEKGLVFEDETGQAKLIDAQALSGLFELFAVYGKCVLLNACFSEIQAHAIAQHIDYVIGMSQAIGDKAAIEFAVGFYDALGGGESVEFAYKFGCQAIRMAGIPEHLTPKLLIKKQLETIGSNINIPVSSNVALDFRFNTFLDNLTDNLSSERGIDYTRLRNFLALEKWFDADKETLNVVLKVTQREQEKWLDVQSINDIPCIDLHTIDQLWVKYSNGRFGFSIQKSIWQDVENNEQAFSYKVGWRILGKWVYHHSLTFSLDALPGHLPFWGRGWCGQGQWVQEVQIGQWANALLSHQNL
ncbi:MAG: GUN4 domain-containing protein [Rhizonema sp. PD38]|nr:GUN4 domain-containing protein [Rhizonema sp. PD38]